MVDLFTESATNPTESNSLDQVSTEESIPSPPEKTSLQPLPDTLVFDTEDLWIKADDLLRKYIIFSDISAERTPRGYRVSLSGKIRVDDQSARFLSRGRTPLVQIIAPDATIFGTHVVRQSIMGYPPQENMMFELFLPNISR